MKGNGLLTCWLPCLLRSPPTSSGPCPQPHSACHLHLTWNPQAPGLLWQQRSQRSRASQGSTEPGGPRGPSDTPKTTGHHVLCPRPAGTVAFDPSPFCLSQSPGWVSLSHSMDCLRGPLSKSCPRGCEHGELVFTKFTPVVQLFQIKEMQVGRCHLLNHTRHSLRPSLRLGHCPAHMPHA